VLGLGLSVDLGKEMDRWRRKKKGEGMGGCICKQGERRRNYYFIRDGMGHGVAGG
jgi:hypothetical protein